MSAIIPGSVTYLENRSSRHAFYLVYAVQMGSSLFFVHRGYGRIGTIGQRQDSGFVSAAAALATCARLVAQKTARGYAVVPVLPLHVIAALRRIDPGYGMTGSTGVGPRDTLGRAEVLASTRYVAVPSALAAGAEVTLHEVELDGRGAIIFSSAADPARADDVAMVLRHVLGNVELDGGATLVMLAGVPSPWLPLQVEVHDVIAFRGAPTLGLRFAERHALLCEIARDGAVRPIGQFAFAPLVSGPARTNVMSAGHCFVRDLTATGGEGWYRLAD